MLRVVSSLFIFRLIMNIFLLFYSTYMQSVLANA